MTVDTNAFLYGNATQAQPSSVSNVNAVVRLQINDHSWVHIQIVANIALKLLNAGYDVRGTLRRMDRADEVQLHIALLHRDDDRIERAHLIVAFIANVIPLRISAKRW